MLSNVVWPTPGFILLLSVTATALMLVLLHGTSLGHTLRERIPDRPLRRLFEASLSFFLTFAGVRGVVYAIQYQIPPFHFIEIGGRHIHHLVFGIMILLLVGYGWLSEIGTGADDSSILLGRLYVDPLSSTKEESISKAKEIAEDWYLQLRGKLRAGEIKSEKTFSEVSEYFLREYDIMTEGQRNERYVEGQHWRSKGRLIPFFGKLGISEITSGKIQDYRIHRHQEAIGKHASHRPIAGCIRRS